MSKPKVSSGFAEKELDRAEQQFDRFQEEIRDFNPLEAKAPKIEVEPQTKMSNREANKADAPYIKPIRSMHSAEKFNEKYRKDWERAWEYVRCIAENREIIGESIELWTKKFAGDPAHFWRIPVNKPVYIPRLVAEQIASCSYHRLRMEDRPTNVEGGMTYYGTMTVEQTVNRLDARPVGSSFVSMAS